MRKVAFLLLIVAFVGCSDKDEVEDINNQDDSGQITDSNNDSDESKSGISYPTSGINGDNLLAMEDGTILTFDQFGSYSVAAELAVTSKLRVEVTISDKSCDLGSGQLATAPLSTSIFESGNDYFDATSNGNYFDVNVNLKDLFQGALTIKVWENEATNPVIKTIKWEVEELNEYYWNIEYGISSEPTLLDLENNFASLNTSDNYFVVISREYCSSVFVLFKNVGDIENSWLEINNASGWTIEYTDNDIKATPLGEENLLSVGIKSLVSDNLTIESYENGESMPARVLTYPIVL